MTHKHDFYLPYLGGSVRDVYNHLVELQDGSAYAIDKSSIIETKPSGEKIRWAIAYNLTDAGKFTHVFLHGEDIED